MAIPFFRPIAKAVASLCLMALPLVPAMAQDKQAPNAVASPAQSRLQPIDDATLSDTRGGQAIVIGNQTLNSSVAASLVGNYTAGAVSFSDSAFANFAGMGNIVINTGAQANLQSAMNLTINLGN